MLVELLVGENQDKVMIDYGVSKDSVCVVSCLTAYFSELLNLVLLGDLLTISNFGFYNLNKKFLSRCVDGWASKSTSENGLTLNHPSG